MLSNSPEGSTTQFRNATKNGAQRGSLRRSPKKSKSDDPIEISDSEEEKTETDGRRSRDSRPSTEEGSLSPILDRNIAHRVKHNEAFVPHRLKRKSESPTDLFRSSAITQDQGNVLVRDSQEDARVGRVEEHTSDRDEYWNTLDADRAFNLSGKHAGWNSEAEAVEKRNGNGAVQSTNVVDSTPRPKLQDSMKLKGGKVPVRPKSRQPVRRNLGNDMRSSILTQGSNSHSAIRRASSATIQAPQEVAPRQEMYLERIGLLHVGAFGELSKPSIKWNSDGALMIRWKEHSGTKTLNLLPDNILEFAVSILVYGVIRHLC